MSKKMGRPPGGKKFGGKPKGYKFPETLAKEAAREIARQRITEKLLPIIDAQVANAIGISHFFLRDEAGQWLRINDPDQIQAALNKGDGYWIYTKDPNTNAARDMLAYALDKPKDQIQEIEVHGSEALLARLDRARLRSAGKLEDK